MKNVIRIVLFILIIIGIILLATYRIWVPKLVSYKLSKEGLEVVAHSYRDASFSVEGTEVTLVNGQSIKPAAPGSAINIVTTYFGNQAEGDLNNDGKDDVGYLVTQDEGGSGTYYYVVVALKTADGYQGLNAVFLGDRIAPQSTEIKNGQLIVNYADRAPTEPMTTSPYIGVSKTLKVSGSVLEVSE